MTKARLGSIQPDGFLAAAYIERAKEFIADAGRDANSNAGRHVLAQNAVIAACDAVLATSGKEVTGADGGHRLRLDAVREILAGDHDELFDRLERTRTARHQVSYAAGLTPVGDLLPAIAAARELVEMAARWVEPHLPPWLDESEG